MKPMWRDGNVYGQVGELSGACYDAVCVYRRTEERDHAFVHHRSETVFVEPVERYDAQDSKRAYSDEYMDGASTVTWNTAPSYNTGTWNGIPAPTSHTISGDPGWWAFPYMKDVVAAMLRNYIDTSLSQTIHEKRGIMIKLADETVGLKTFRSSNHSENRPNMSITYTNAQPYGAAWAHRQFSASSSLNCWGFALGKNTSIDAVFSRSGELTLSDIDLAYLFSNYSVDHGYVSSMRIINSATAQIDSNEFRVAFRGKKTYVYNPTTLRFELYIYHFMVQTNTGGWSHKPSVGTHVGSEPVSRASVNEGSINPSVNGLYWINWVTEPDSSATVYFAVKN